MTTPHLTVGFSDDAVTLQFAQLTPRLLTVAQVGELADDLAAAAQAGRDAIVSVADDRAIALQPEGARALLDALARGLDGFLAHREMVADIDLLDG